MKSKVVPFFSLLLAYAAGQSLEEPLKPANIAATKPCFVKGELIRTTFANLKGEGIWIGLYPKNEVKDFSNLPSFDSGTLKGWILTCGQRDNCDEWKSEGTVRFATDELDYGEYVVTASGDRATKTSQAHSESFIVDAHCPERHEWRPATPDQQRSPCPFLNTAANHGFLNRNGTFINVDEMANSLEALYNVASDFLIQGPIEQMIDCNQTYFDENGVRRFDLDILFDDKCEEHEASMVRADSFFGFERSKKVDDGLLNNLMRMNHGKNFLTLDNVFDFQADRIMDSRLVNPETEFRHFDVGNMGAQAMFLFLLSSDNSMRTVEKDRLYFFLLDEKLPDDFEPGSLREVPFNPKDPADFVFNRLEASMNNVETMMHTSIASALRGEGRLHSDANADHDHGV